MRSLGLSQFEILNHNFESSVRRWAKDGAENTLRYEYDLGSEDIVFDIGGYEGSWAAEIVARYGSHIHIFEPVPEYYQQICRRFERNPKIHAYPFGLSNVTRSTSFGLESDASGQWKTTTDKVEVKLRDIVEILGELNLPRVSLCKINIEGAEFELLNHLIDAGLIDRFENLQIQFHSFVPDATRRMEAIQSRLEQTHFLTYQYSFVWENWQLNADACCNLGG